MFECFFEGLWGTAEVRIEMYDRYRFILSQFLSLEVVVSTVIERVLLFKNWLNREYGQSVTEVRAINGKGGDGGVEAYAILSNGGAIGVPTFLIKY